MVYGEPREAPSSITEVTVRAAAQLQFLPPVSYQIPNGSASHWDSSFLSHGKEKAPAGAVSGWLYIPACNVLSDPMGRKGP